MFEICHIVTLKPYRSMLLGHNYNNIGKFISSKAIISKAQM